MNETLNRIGEFKRNARRGVVQLTLQFGSQLRIHRKGHVADLVDGGFVVHDRRFVRLTGAKVLDIEAIDDIAQFEQATFDPSMVGNRVGSGQQNIDGFVELAASGCEIALKICLPSKIEMRIRLRQPSICISRVDAVASRTLTRVAQGHRQRRDAGN